MAYSQDIINECWRSIDGYINYQVSNTGRVRNASNGKMLSDLRVDGRGYVMVRLCKDGVGKNHKTHRLVAELFIPKPNSDTKLEVDHIDKDKRNNIATNLRWVTPQQNMWNRNKRTPPSTSRYIGVSYHKRCHKWNARIMGHDRKLYLGASTTRRTPLAHTRLKRMSSEATSQSSTIFQMTNAVCIQYIPC